MANIYFSTLDRKKIYELPILPEVMPELSKSAKNEIFETFNNGEYNFLGNNSLVSFTLEGWLPIYPNKYRWAKSQEPAYNFINLWSLSMNNKQPIRIVINRNKSSYYRQELLNWVISIEAISWHEINESDVAYKIDCKEYREVKV